MSLLYLVRHGQASAGTHDYDRLSETGRQQARLLGHWWKTHEFKPDHVHHGTLVRQRDTALSALEAMEIPSDQMACQVHAGLDEYKHRIVESYFAHESANETPESMTFEEYLGIMQRWRDQAPVKNAPEPELPMESWHEFKARGWQTVQALHKNGQAGDRHVFFTSGGVIANIVSNVLDLDFEHTIDAIWRIRNSSVTTLHYDGENARLVDFNTIPHLQTRPDRSLITLI